MRHGLTATLTLLLICSPLLAQAPDDLRPPALLVQIEKGKPAKPLAVSHIDARVVLTGFVAETSVTMTFTNPHDRVLEGELVFPLPAGATVAGYGLDVDGELVDAVIIEKQRARQIFESEVRKGVDPGIVEWVSGNNFRTRVYPIRAESSRTVRVVYTNELTPTAKGMQYRLPLHFDRPVGEFAFTAICADAGRTAKLKSGPIHHLDTKMTDVGPQLSATRKDVKLDRNLVLDLSDAKKRPVLVENDLDEKDTFFVVRDTVAPPAQPDAAARRRGVVGLFWDASLSRAKTDKRREFDLIRAFCKANPAATIEVHLFRDRRGESQTFQIKNGNARPLIDYLEKIKYDGGTDLGELIIPDSNLHFYSTEQLQVMRIAPMNYAYHLLFTDGLGNLSDAVPHAAHPQGGDWPRPASPIYTVAAASNANHPLLGHIAEQRGGEYLDLNRLKPEDAAKRLGAPPFSLNKIEYDDKQITDVYPTGAVPVNGAFTVAGRLLTDQATLTLHFGRDGKTAITRQYTVNKADAIDRGRAPSTGLVARLWAQQQLGELIIFPEANHDKLLKLGKRFDLVTPATSFLVLETVAQHVEYGIAPAPSRKDLLAQFNQRIEHRQAREEKDKHQRLDRVATLWQEKVKWWEREFKYPKNLRVRNDKGKRPAAGEDGGEVLDEVLRSVEGARERAGLAPQFENAPEMNLEDALDSGTRGGRSAGQGGGSGGLFSSDGQDADGVDALLNTAGQITRPGVAGKAAEPADTGPTARIGIKAWNPTMPYLKAMKIAGKDKAYDEYLKQRIKYANSPAFYFDCCDFFANQQQPDYARRVLTNILELKLDDPRLLRIVAHKLVQAGDLDTAAYLFERVILLRPEEPQSYRDLALVRARQGDHETAIDLLYKVATDQWHGRFSGVEVIALMEMNNQLRILARAGQEPSRSEPIDPRLIKPLPADVRIVLDWDVDATDIDLWVIEPSGEKCSYNHNRTHIGGHLSKDITQGYGPEEYFVRKAMPGEYTIKAHFYGSGLQQVAGAATVKATVITNFGREGEQRRDMTIRLDTPKELIHIGAIQIGETEKK